MEELLNKLKELNAIRAIGDYSDYEPDGKHKDTIYFAEDEEKIYLNGKSYGGSDISGLLEDYAKVSDLDNYVQKEEGKVLTSNDFTDDYKEQLDSLDETYATNTSISSFTESVNTKLNNKVDKVAGKQLSTEDFTTVLKQKLEGLTNYNDEELSAKIDNLTETLNIILNENDTTSVIDTWQEVKEFLESVTNEETLVGLLKDLKDDIVALCADTYVPKKDGTTHGQFTMEYADTLKAPTVFRTGTIGAFTRYSNSDKTLGYIGIGSNGKPLFYIGDDIATSYTLLHSGLGTSSQFLKADGSVDSTAYLPKRGGEITGVTTISVPNDRPLRLVNGENNNWTLISFNDVSDNIYFGYNKINDRFQTSKPLYVGTAKAWTENNDGSGSGLDADLLDGKHNGELTAKNFTVTNVSNTDNLNDITDAGLYGSANSLSPINFHSHNSSYLVLRSSRGDVFQIACSYNAGDIVYRYRGNNINDPWTSWKKIAFTDSNVASADKLTTKQLTNEDLNDIKEGNFSSYYANGGNTCTNKPINNASSFLLQAFGQSVNYCTQVVTYPNSDTYKRYNNNGTWTPWKKMLTEYDIADYIKSKVLTRTEYNALTTKNANTLYFIKE